MNKLVLAVVALLAFTSFAEARDRYHNRHGAHSNHQRQHHRHYHPSPWVYGGAALGLGLLGTGIYMNYQPRCWREFAGYDYYGRPEYRRYCE